jgi:hypothetical protein|eukprot:scaffold10588_cov225-Chaetoceros_neogracile.AAC.2
MLVSKQITRAAVSASFLSPKAMFQSRRNVHSTRQLKKSALETPILVRQEEESSPAYSKRFFTSTEVLVSKIFPAGLGWQSSSIVAEEFLNFAPESVSFALTTGAGDALGVFFGHCAYYSIKKSITDNPQILMKRERDTGILLGSAAFCSGSVWQPLVTMLQGADFSFLSVFTGTWIGCGTAFYLGLRGARTILPGFLEYVEEPTYENSKNDASLSIAIGGATGFFVGTDTAYLPDQNFLIEIVGIQDGTSTLGGCVIAGTSTSLGFAASQTGLNLAYPKGKCWND